MTEPQLHVCPLCATYVEVEGGYDGPYFEWSCDHRHVAEPERIPVSLFRNPTNLEAWRSAWCGHYFAAQWTAAREQRRAIEASTPGARYIAPPHDCTWSPADRRKRKEWRDLGSTGQFSAILKAHYAGPIREALQQGSVFLAAMHGEVCDAAIDFHRDINRTVIGDQAIIPLRRGTE